MVIRARNLARDYRSNADQFFQDLQEAVDLATPTDEHPRGRPGGLTLRDFSIRDLAEELIMDEDGSPVGFQFVKLFCNPASPMSHAELQEAFTAVDSSAFTGVIQQLLIREVLASYRNPAFVLSNIIPTIPTPFTDGEIVPGMTLPRNPENDAEDALELGEQEEYKVLGFGEEWTQSPKTIKRGCVIALSREMLFRDRTGLAIRRAQFVGTILGQSKERRITDVVIGAVNNYKEKRLGDADITTRRTYYSAADTNPPWINHLDGNDMVDYTDLDNIDQMIANRIDPNTGEPIVLGNLRDFMFMPPKRSQIGKLFGDTRYEEVNGSRTQSFDNPVRSNVRRFENIWAYHRLQRKLGLSAADAAGYMFYGDFAAAFEYLENWPIEISRQGAGSDAEFWQDIVLAFKASERGAAAVRDPRFVNRIRAVATSSSGTP